MAPLIIMVTQTFIKRVKKALPRAVPLILILLGLFLHGCWEKDPFFLKLNYPFYYKLLDTIFFSVIIVGAIGLLLELYHYTKYFEERLTVFFSNETFLKCLNKNRLKEILDRVMMLLYHGDVTASEALFPVVRDEIFPFLAKPYSQNYRVIISSEVEESNPQVLKRVQECEYDIKNPISEEIKYSFRIITVLFKVDGFEKEKIAQILNLEIDNKKISDPKFYASDLGETVRFSYTQEIILKNKPVHIKYKIKKIIPVKDTLYLFKTDYPIYNYRLTFYFIGDALFSIDACVFGIGKKENISRSKNMITVEFPGWLFPGHGIGVCYQKKS